MPDIRQKPTTRPTNPFTAMTTELNSLAQNAGALSNTVIDSHAAGLIPNTDELDLLCDLELKAVFAAAPTDGQQLEVYFVPTFDGTNFATHTTGASSIGPKNMYVGSFIVAGTGTTQYLPLWDIDMPLTDFKALIINRAGALAASGSILKVQAKRMQAI